MYKIYLAVCCLLFSFGTMAQTNSGFVSQDPGVGGEAIYIAISNAYEADGDSYLAEGEVSEKRGDLNDALTLFGKAAFEYNSSGKYGSYGDALLKLSNIHLKLNHYTEAEQVVLNVALKNYSRIGNRRGQMDSYSQLGKVYFAANKLTESLWFYTQQGILAKQLNNNPAYIDSMLGIVLVKIKKKEYGMALKDVNRAELLARSMRVNQYNAQIKDTKNIIKLKGNYKK